MLMHIYKGTATVKGFNAHYSIFASDTQEAVTIAVTLSRAVLMGLEMNSLRSSVKSQMMLPFSFPNSTAHLKLSCKQKGFLRGN